MLEALECQQKRLKEYQKELVFHTSISHVTIQQAHLGYN